MEAHGFVRLFVRSQVGEVFLSKDAVVAGKGKVCPFLGYRTTHQVILARKDVTKSHPVVKDAEDEVQFPLRVGFLLELDGQFMKVVPDQGRLAKVECPVPVRTPCLYTGDTETTIQVLLGGVAPAQG